MSDKVPAPEKWKLLAWPQGQYPVKDTDAGSFLFSCSYATQGKLFRLAPFIHQRFPDADMGMQLHVMEFPFWVGKEIERLYWCPCGGRLEFVEPVLWFCVSCGKSQPDKTLRPELYADDEDIGAQR